MKILFVRSGKIGSKLIRWGTSEPVSHVAVEFESSKFIYHSYISGIRPIEKPLFKEHYEVVCQIDLHIDYIDDEKMLRAFCAMLPEKQFYDYGALFYFAWRAALHKFFRVPYPRYNHWQDGEGFLCTEITYVLGEVIAEQLGIMLLPENHDIAMTSPWNLYELLKRKIKANGLSFSATSSVDLTKL